MLSPLAGKPPTADILPNIPRIVARYYNNRPGAMFQAQRVAFGTSGHRGSSLDFSFNEAHIVSIAMAICLYRNQRGYTGPLFLGMDTHALSEPAFATVLEVLIANGVVVRIDRDLGFTPTPVISRSIIEYNAGRTGGLADGIVITPSHNPPADGGIKYNPPHGGPAGSEVTRAIEAQANEFLDGWRSVHRIAFKPALAHSAAVRTDYIGPYVAALSRVLDMDAIRSSGLRMGVDPLGGAGIAYWGRIADQYKLNLTIVNPEVDPSFRFMRVDWDGRIRMDCSSPHAMAGLIALKDRFDVAFACDPDHDRHGIVAPSVGLLNPNHYLAVCVNYLFRNRPGWSPTAGIGKTLVSSSMLDRVAAALGRPLVEVPVGFKHFVDGLGNGTLGFGGEESAGASFLQKDGTAWTTDKDGLILGLLAGEIMAKSGRDPGELYQDLTNQFGAPVYQRTDAPATPEQKQILSQLNPRQVSATHLAGEPIEAVLTNAPGNGEPIGGLKVITTNGWFAARPSGTENVYKIYAESFLGQDHLKLLQTEAQQLIHRTLQ